MPLGAKESHGSPAPKNCPPAHVVSGTGTCCHVLPPSNETAAMMSWKGPWIQAATMLLGWTGFTATKGSSVWSVGQVPNRLKPSLQLPTAFGRESSMSERGDCCAHAGSVSRADTKATATK